MNESEKLALRNGLIGAEFHATNKASKPAKMPVAPKSWDWRDKGVITPVKNEDACKNCKNLHFSSHFIPINFFDISEKGGVIIKEWNKVGNFSLIFF